MTEPPAIPELQTPRLLLRRLVEADALGLNAVYGDPLAMRFWDLLPSRDVAETTARIRRSIEISSEWHAAFAVLLRDDGEFVGMVNYHRRVPLYRKLAVGWILAPRWWRHGFAEESTRALLDHCVTALDAHRIEAHIETDNQPSLRLAERLGFRREGLMRDCLFVDGKPRTAFLYALLRPDWENPASQ